jgi:hypothetical protein
VPYAEKPIGLDTEIKVKIVLIIFDTILINCLDPIRRCS